MFKLCSYIDMKSVFGGNGECSVINGWFFGICGDDDLSECYFFEVVVNSKFGVDSDCLDGIFFFINRNFFI